MSGAAVEESLIPEDPEDLKLITLARAALARTGARQGAAVRDTDGRAYAASSGASGIEAAALLSEQRPSAEDLEVLRDLAGNGVAVWWADERGTVHSVIEL